MNDPTNGFDADTVNDVLGEVLCERLAQHLKWGRQDHPQGTGPVTHPLSSIPHPNAGAHAQARHFRRLADVRGANGRLTWADILLEETFEALAEDDPEKLRAELVQVAAVAVAMIESLDRGVSDPSEKVNP